MDLERRQTMKPECNINGCISQYDMCMTTPDTSFTEGFVYVGRGTIHSVKGRLQEDSRVMHFYRKDTTILGK